MSEKSSSFITEITNFVFTNNSLVIKIDVLSVFRVKLVGEMGNEAETIARLTG